jgi:hypothetical protein
MVLLLLDQKYQVRSSESMKYQNQKHGFLIDLPDDWVETRIRLKFTIVGGKISFSKVSGGAHLNIAVGRLPSNWVDKNVRAKAFIDWMKNFYKKTSPNYYCDNVKKINTEITFAGEKNVVYTEERFIDGKYGGLISIVRSDWNKMEYVIQHKELEKYRTEVKIILDSFKFCNKYSLNKLIRLSSSIYLGIIGGIMGGYFNPEGIFIPHPQWGPIGVFLGGLIGWFLTPHFFFSMLLPVINPIIKSKNILNALLGLFVLIGSYGLYRKFGLTILNIVIFSSLSLSFIIGD